MRLFIALNFPDEIIDALERLQEELPVGRLVPRENLHLTIAFLGEVRVSDGEALDDALTGIRADVFPLTLSGVGAFETANGTVVWAGVTQSPPLDALHLKVRAAVHGAGLMTPRERFRPHVTLARLSGQPGSGDAARLATFLSVWGAKVIGSCVVQGLSLMQSHLGPKGSRYEELAHYPFAGALPQDWG